MRGFDRPANYNISMNIKADYEMYFSFPYSILGYTFNATLYDQQKTVINQFTTTLDTVNNNITLYLPNAIISTLNPEKTYTWDCLQTDGSNFKTMLMVGKVTVYGD